MATVKAQEKFDRAVQSLCPELFNNLLENVLALDSDHVKEIVIDKNYKPPVQFQIDRASRQRLTLDYYTRTTFVFHIDIEEPNSSSVLGKCLQSLSEASRMALTGVQARTNAKVGSPSLTAAASMCFVMSANMTAAALRAELASLYGMKLRDDAICFHVCVQT